jgi:hypothetical protein
MPAEKEASKFENAAASAANGDHDFPFDSLTADQAGSAQSDKARPAQAPPFEVVNLATFGGRQGSGRLFANIGAPGGGEAPQERKPETFFYVFRDEKRKKQEEEMKKGKRRAAPESEKRHRQQFGCFLTENPKMRWWDFLLVKRLKTKDKKQYC